jgi:protein TonB
MKKPEITDKDILKHMDFDGLLTKHQAITKTVISQKLKWGVAVLLLSTFTILYFIINTKKITNAIGAKETKSLAEPFPNQTLVPQDSQQVERKKESKLIVAEPSKKEVPKAESIESKKKFNEEDIYLEAEPTFGYPHLYNYFNTNLRYPQEAVKDSVQGVATITFIITPQGKTDQVKITQSLGQSFDAEAIRLLVSMPAWKPATLNGSPVPSKISLPLTFKIENTKKQ